MSAASSAYEDASLLPSALPESMLEALESRVLLSVLYTEADFARMRQEIAAGAEPWVSGYNALISDGYSQTKSSPRPLQTVIRGGDGQNFNQMVVDMQRTYQLAVRWKVSGDTSFANQAVSFLNAWSSTMTTLTGNADRFLASGLYGFGWAAAADIMKSYSGWASADVQKFQNYLVGIYYPMQHDFLVNHNGAYITNYWANWDLANVEGMMAVGLFADRTDIYQEAVDYLYNGKGNGALDKAFYYLHPGNLMQWQESGRDQGHTILGMQLFGHIAQMAWNQGLDLFSYNNYEFLAAAEYIAKYNLGYDVPFETYNWGTGQSGAWSTQTSISGASRGDMDVGYELIYAHYVERLGMAAPYTAQRIAACGTEWRGSGDDFGFGTLTYRLVPVSTANLTPRGLTAVETGRGNIQLDWFGTSNATGYTLYRATSADGAYTKIASNITDLLTYTDRNLPAGVYYYKVTGIVPGGETGFSSIVHATSTYDLQTRLLFDENTGAIAYDAAGNGHTGTLNGGAAWTSGRSGSAVSLDGIDDYVSLPAGLIAGVNDFTISAWVYLNESRTWSRIFDFGDDRGRYMYLTPRNANGVVEFGTSTVYGYNKQAITGTAALPTNQWVFVTVTLSEKVGRLYVNGILVGANTGMDFPPAQFQSTQCNWIGRSQFASDPYLKGKVDDFRIYRGAMAAGEIYTLATAIPPPAVPAAPASITTTAVLGNQVNLSWSAVSGATSGYTLLRATASGGPYTVIATRITGTTYSNTGLPASLAAGTPYYYIVTAGNNGGESLASPQAAVIALPPMPAMPASLAAQSNSPTSILLTWNAATNAASYTVKRASSSGGPYVTLASGLTTTTFTDAGLTTNTMYYYVVTAVNAAGESSNSNESVDAPSELRTHLAFDEAVGDTATDSSVNGWDGTLVNGPLWTAGRMGTAIDLDGTDDYVSLPADVVNGLTTVTIAAWINIDAVATWQRLFDFGTGTTNYMFLTTQYSATSGSNDRLRFAIRTPSVSEQVINSTTATPIGSWVHVAVVLNGSTGTLYLNGVQVGQNTAMTLTPASLGGTTLNYLGKSQFADPYFNGKIDDFRIYSRPLSAAEVLNLARLIPSPPPNVSAGDAATANQIHVTWSPVLDATGYDVWRSTANNSATAILLNATAIGGTSYDDSTAAPGALYYYWVKARGIGGISPLSAGDAGLWIVSGPGDFTLTTSGGVPTFTLAGGMLAFLGDAAMIGSGAMINVAAGAVVSFNTPQHLGGLNVAAGGKVQIAPDAGPLVVDAIAISSAGSLDLTNNDLIIHQGTMTQLIGLIAQGCNGGDWLGMGITSSAAASTPHQALGLMTGGVFHSLAGTTAFFANQSVSASDLLVKYTWVGDADLSGCITLSDYAQLDNAFLFKSLIPTPQWVNGDSNYDGQIDGRDYALIDGAFQQQSGPLAQEMIQSHTGRFGAAYTAALLQTFVQTPGPTPEPTPEPASEPAPEPTAGSTPAPLLSDTQRLVQQIYRRLLNRMPENAGLAYWTAQFDAGASVEEMAAAIAAGPEYQRNLIDGMYLQFLGRHAESTGLACWLAQVQAGTTREAIQTAILSSEEYVRRNGGTSASFISGVYRDVLHRVADPAGLEAWLGLLEGTAIDASSLRSVAAGIVASEEARNVYLVDQFQMRLSRAPTVAEQQAWRQQGSSGDAETRMAVTLAISLA